MPRHLRPKVRPDMTTYAPKPHDFVLIPTQNITVRLRRPLRRFAWARLFRLPRAQKFSCTLRKHETLTQENRDLLACRGGSDLLRLHAGDEQHLTQSLKPVRKE